MSQVNVDVLSSLLLMEPVASAAPARSASDDSAFTEHLARAQSETDAPATGGSTAPEPRSQTSRGKAESSPSKSQPSDSADEGQSPRDNPEESATPAPAAAEGTAADKAEKKDAEAADDASDPVDDQEQELVASANPAVAQAVISGQPSADKVVEKAPLESGTKQTPQIAGEKKAAARGASSAGVQQPDAAAAKAQPAESVLPQATAETAAQAASQTENQTLAVPGRERRARAARPAAREQAAEESQQASDGKDGKSKADPRLAEAQAQPAADPAPTASTEPAAATALPAATDAKSTDLGASGGRKKASAAARSESPETIEATKVASPDGAPAAVVPRVPVAASADPADTDERKPEAAAAVAPSRQANTGNITPPSDPTAGSAAASRMGSTAVNGSGVNSTAGAAKDDRAEQGRQAERVRFAQRVSRAFEAVGQRNGSLRIKLSPPELGSLRLEIAVQQGVLSARLEAETPAARNLLLESLPALRDRLAQQDIRIERFDVELMDRRPGGNAEQPGGQPQSGRQSSERSASRRESRVEAAASAAVGESRAGQVDGEANHLNVII